MEIERLLLTGRIAEAVADALPAGASLELRIRKEDEVEAEDLEWADAYAGFKPPPALSLDLPWVHSFGAGVESFLVPGILGEETLLTRTSGCLGDKIAEYCLAHVLAELQRLRVFANQASQREWRQEIPRDLESQRILVFGTGDIGSAVAEKLFGLGCRVDGLSRSGKEQFGFEQVWRIGEAWRTALDEYDWLILTLPHTPETERLFDAELFSQMNAAKLINVGRGALIDENDLLAALDKGEVELAVLDVFETEPLPTDSRLWEQSGVVVTPHVAALTDPIDAARILVEVVDELRAGSTPQAKVDRSRGY